MQLVRALTSFVVFAGVVFLSGLITFWGIEWTGLSLAKLVTAAPVKSSSRPTYVSTLRPTKSDAFNIATVVRVEPQVPAGPAGKSTLEASVEFSHTVTVESLRVRSGPNRATPQLFALKGGSKVRALKLDRGWAMVEAEDGRTGWVYYQFLRPIRENERLSAEL